MTGSVPHGFIIVTNGPGDSDSSPLPSNESIFNNQLFTGVFVANNGVFSTDESLLQAWMDYNNSGHSGNAPPTDGLTDNELSEVLAQNRIDLNQPYYIWVDDTNTFRMTEAAPQWKTGSVNTGASPDGTPDPMGVGFPTIGLSVDPIGECGFNQTLFGVQPDPATDYLGVDTATWTPSSGSSNLLGTLNFNESISGTALVTSAPPPCGGPWIAQVQNYMSAADVYYIGEVPYTAEIDRLGQGHVTSVTYSSFFGQFLSTTVTFDDSGTCADHSFNVVN